MADTQALTQVDFAEEDFAKAKAIAQELGYEQTVYTSTSALWGLFCVPENPRYWRGKRRALEGGCIIKTLELGLLFVQGGEDLHLGYMFGQLEFRADIDGCGRISHVGEYRYIGEVGGMLAFVETVDPPVYLAPDEVLGFRVTGR